MIFLLNPMELIYTPVMNYTECKIKYSAFVRFIWQKSK